MKFTLVFIQALIKKQPHLPHIITLQKAKENIQQNKNEYICSAVRNVALSDRVRREISDLIHFNLSPHNDVKRFLCSKYNIPWGELTYERLKDVRLRWIDEMIQYYKELDK